MKALTLWQPYASLLITDVKKYETRSWQTKYRGPIAIHAAKQPIKQVAKLLPEDVRRAINAIVKKNRDKKITFPLSMIVGTADLVECHLIDEDFLETLSEDEMMMGDFTIGRYAWEFKNKSTAMQVPDIIGGQGLWNWQKEAS